MKRLNEILKSIIFFLAPSSAENFKVVVLCVIAATTFWFFTALNKSYTTRINYPIEFKYESEGLVAVKDVPNDILVDVTGGGWSLLKRTIGWEITPVVVPLEHVTNIRYIKGAALYPEIASHLKEVKLNYVATDTLFFDIQKSIERRLKLWVNDSSISLDKNHRVVSKITLSQDCVLVTGPEKLINQLPAILELKISKKGIDKNFNEKIKIPLFENSLIKLASSEIGVSFEVGQFITKEFEVDIKKIGFSEDLAKLVPDKALLKINIQESLLGDWTPADFELIAYKKDFNRKDSTVIVNLTRFPSLIKEISTKNPKLRLKYE